MKKVLLVSPLTESYSGIQNYGVPSIGIHRIATFLESNGQDVTIYDCNIHNNIDSFLTKEYDIIGISILNDTLPLSLKLFIRLHKIYPNALLVAGGAEAIVNYEAIFDNSPCNTIVLGEGESPMLELCNDIPIGQIKGIIFRKTGVEIDDNLLWQYYKNIDFLKMGWREYWKKNQITGDPKNVDNVIRLVTSSHCNRGCNFCSLTRLHEFSCGKKVKPAMLNSEQINILIDRALEQLPETTHIYFVEDSILPVPSRIDDFCKALSKYKGRLKFLVQTETDKTTKEVIRKLSEVDVIHITFGVENCSPKIRKAMGKPQNSERIENIINWCKEYNIRCYYLIILFSPESDVNDLIINYTTLKRWQEEGNVTISIEPFMMPYKGADIYYSAYDFGYRRVELENGRVLKHPYIIYPADPTVKQMMMEFKEKLPSYLDSFNAEEQHVHRSKDHTGKVMVKLLGDILIRRGFIE